MFYNLSREGQRARDEARSGHELQTDVRRDTSLAHLETDIERLLMITEALWQIVREKHGLDPHELHDRVEAIDMRDGALDGKVSAPAAAPPCPHCNRPLARHRPYCMYCGGPVEQDLWQR